MIPYSCLRAPARDIRSASPASAAFAPSIWIGLCVQRRVSASAYDSVSFGAPIDVDRCAGVMVREQ